MGAALRRLKKSWRYLFVGAGKMPDRCGCRKLTPYQDERTFESEDGFDFGVEGDVGGGEAVDGEAAAVEIREVEEAADVIVLVEAGEEALGFLGR